MKNRSDINRRVGGPTDVWPDIELDHQGPPTRRSRREGPKGPPPVRTGKYILAVIGLLVAVTVVWFVFHPNSLAAIYYRFSNEPPAVKGLVIEVEGEQKVLAPGETLTVHPQDKLLVISFESNRWHNYGLKLESPSLNLDIFNEPKSLLWLLGEDAFVEPKFFTLNVNQGGQVLASFHLQSQMQAVDWVGRAKQAESTEKKIYYYQLALSLAPDDPTVAEHLAGLFKDAGDIKGVIDIYEKSMGGKDDPAVLKKILAVYQGTKDLDKMEDTYRRLVAVSPEKEALAYLGHLGALQKKRNRLSAAVKTYNQMLDMSPANKKDEALKYLLAVYHQAKNVSAMVNIYKKLIPLVPDAEKKVYWGNLANLYEQLKKTEEAAAAYESLVPLLDKEEKATALKKIGFLQAKNKKVDEAIKAYEQAAKIDPKDSTVFLNLARLHQSKGDKKAYKEYLAKVEEMKPDDVDTTLQVVEASVDTGDKKDAEERLYKILEQAPDNMKARLMLVKMLEEKNSSKALIPHYIYIMKQEPENKIVIYNLGAIYYKLGNLKDAEEMMKKVVELDDQDADAHQFLFNIYQKQKKDEAAVDEATALIRLKPGQNELYDYVYHYLDNRRKYDELIKAAKEWSEANPDELKFKGYYAMALEHGGKLEKAADVYAEIAVGDPKNMDLRMHLAELYEQLKKYDDAVRVYDEIIANDPKNEAAYDARLKSKLKAMQQSKKP